MVPNPNPTPSMSFRVLRWLRRIRQSREFRKEQSWPRNQSDFDLDFDLDFGLDLSTSEHDVYQNEDDISQSIWQGIGKVFTSSEIHYERLIPCVQPDFGPHSLASTFIHSVHRYNSSGVRQCIEAGLDLNTALDQDLFSSGARTLLPLEVAAELGTDAIAMLLIESGARPPSRPRDLHHLIDTAISRGLKRTAVEVLALNSGMGFIHAHGASLLSRSVEHGNEPVVAQLIRMGLPANLKLEDFVNQSVDKGHDSITTTLLGRSGSLTPYRWDLGSMAISVENLMEKWKIRLATVLLSCGPQNIPSFNPDLERAIACNDYQAARDLLVYGSSVISMRELLFINQGYTRGGLRSIDGRIDYIADLCHSLIENPPPDLARRSNICPTCMKWVAGRLNWYKPRTDGLKASLEILRESSRSYGCVLCATIHEIATACGYQRESENVDVSLSGWMPLEIRIKFRRGEEKKIKLIATGKLDEEQRNTGDASSMRSIRTDLFTCLTKHPACIKAEDPFPILPTRVLDIGSSPSVAQDLVLIHSKGQRGTYITLSHRWLGTITQTTILNLDAMCRSIPWDSLTKTMQEAVTTARSLGVRYLWIDSLCIIQDSPSDWSLEATRMAAVYQNSLLNIAADCSHDHAEGFFRPQALQRRLVYIPDEAIKGQSAENKQLPHVCYALEYTHDSSEHVSALDSRGWVLQEQLLSPRSVKFCESSMEWECATLGSSPFKKAFRSLHLTDTNSRREVHLFWHRLVESYVSRTLTKNSDRLMAIAGIANYAGAKLGQKPLAGLWEDNLWHDLLWKATGGPHRRINHPMPTWSWACVDGPVVYDWPKTSLPAYAKSSLEILSTAVDEAISRDGVHGSLVLKGRVLEVDLDPDGRLELNLRFWDGRRRRDIMMREHERTLRWYPDIPLNERNLLYRKQKLWLLEVARDTHYHCLCLLRARKTGHFQRVGMCRIDTTRFNLGLEGKLQRLTLV